MLERTKPNRNKPNRNNQKLTAMYPEITKTEQICLILCVFWS